MPEITYNGGPLNCTTTNINNPAKIHKASAAGHYQLTNGNYHWHVGPPPETEPELEPAEAADTDTEHVRPKRTRTRAKDTTQ